MHCLTPFRFGTKAETLGRLDGLLSRSGIPKFIHFTLGEWEASRESMLDRIADTFPLTELIIRSSSRNEDGANCSMAGYFLSVASVLSSDRDSLTRAIAEVAKSYVAHNGDDVLDEQILVQRMVGDITMSGVLFTRDMNTGAPYYVINYDDQTGRTDSVSSGTGYCNRTLFVLRSARGELASERFQKLLSAVAEVEAVVGEDCLDIEFGVDFDLNVHIFQVRPITSVMKWDVSLPARIESKVRELRGFFKESAPRKPGVCGNSTIYGRMPDWNPAEIIGASPRTLAYSLYSRLITDRAWSEARAMMGYMPSTGRPLMVSFSGQPFIDIQLSFHSFLPSGLPVDIGDKLVDSWLDRLERNPHFHDKVEFDVAFTTLDFAAVKRFNEREGKTLDKRERNRFLSELGGLTRHLLTGETAGLEKQIALVDTLEKLRTGSNPSGPFPQRLRALIDACIAYGTIPFSILARHAFIATAMLRSLVVLDVFSSRDAELFQQSIPTVASDFLHDLRLLSESVIDVDGFMKKYGHLRPGTYDILSPRYDRRPDLLTSLTSRKTPHEAMARSFALSPAQGAEIDRLLKSHDYPVDAGQLLSYIARSIQCRESSKFLFTRTVSDILETIADWGREHGLDKGALSFMSIDDILALADAGASGKALNAAKTTIRANALQYGVTKAIPLPFLITNDKDLVIAPAMVGQPNFVTSKRIEGTVEVLRNESTPETLSGKIVFIESADPGYDWIFAGDPKGLITKYGGTNSHMAIRCAEFDLPAAFGCGEQMFERLRLAKSIALDCSAKTIIPLC